MFRAPFDSFQLEQGPPFVGQLLSRGIAAPHRLLPARSGRALAQDVPQSASADAASGPPSRWAWSACWRRSCGITRSSTAAWRTCRPWLASGSKARVEQRTSVPLTAWRASRTPSPERRSEGASWHRTRWRPSGTNGSAICPACWRWRSAPCSSPCSAACCWGCSRSRRSPSTTPRPTCGWARRGSVRRSGPADSGERRWPAWACQPEVERCELYLQGFAYWSKPKAAASCAW